VGSAAARRWVWLGLLVFLPVPLFGLELGLVPVIRLMLLGSLAGGIALQDPDSVSLIFTAVLGGQALLWGALLYLVAGFLVHRLPVAAPFAIVAVLALGSLFPVYTTPFSSSATRSSILQIFD